MLNLLSAESLAGSLKVQQCCCYQRSFAFVSFTYMSNNPAVGTHLHHCLVQLEATAASASAVPSPLRSEVTAAHSKKSQFGGSTICSTSQYNICSMGCSSILVANEKY